MAADLIRDARLIRHGTVTLPLPLVAWTSVGLDARSSRTLPSLLDASTCSDRVSVAVTLPLLDRIVRSPRTPVALTLPSLVVRVAPAVRPATATLPDLVCTSIAVEGGNAMVSWTEQLHTI